VTTDTPRKPGAQPGNQHALKHGFYSRHFNANETDRIEEGERYSLDNEIDLLRVCIDRLTEQLKFEKENTTDRHGNTITDDYNLKSLNTLSLMAQGVSTMIRTHYLTKGKGGTVELSILQALEELRDELGI
jgi:hypothetical protein